MEKGRYSVEEFGGEIIGDLVRKGGVEGNVG